MDMYVRLNGGTSDVTVSRGAWDKGCVQTEGGQGVVLSYSDGSVEDSGTIGSGAWHVKGCSLAHSHREYPGTQAISSGRVELLYTLRCPNTIRSDGWEGEIHHMLDNEGVVKKMPTPRPWIQSHDLS